MTKALTLIGFDFGEKRIGVAVGQTLTGTATPLETIPALAGIPDWNRIARLIQQWRPQALIVGEPLNMDGTKQEITATATGFADELRRRFALPVMLADERLSSYEARQRLKDTYHLDPVAAQAILETWLSEHSSLPDNDATISKSASNAKSR